MIFPVVITLLDYLVTTAALPRETLMLVITDYFCTFFTSLTSVTHRIDFRSLHSITVRARVLTLVLSVTLLRRQQLIALTTIDLRLFRNTSAWMFTVLTRTGAYVTVFVIISDITTDAVIYIPEEC